VNPTLLAVKVRLAFWPTGTLPKLPVAGLIDRDPPGTPFPASDAVTEPAVGDDAVTEATFAPAVVGWKTTWNMQEPPTGTDAVQVLKVMLNSAALAPPRARDTD